MRPSQVTCPWVAGWLGPSGVGLTFAGSVAARVGSWELQGTGSAPLSSAAGGGLSGAHSPQNPPIFTPFVYKDPFIMKTFTMVSVFVY